MGGAARPGAFFRLDKLGVANDAHEPAAIGALQEVVVLAGTRSSNADRSGFRAAHLRCRTATRDAFVVIFRIQFEISLIRRFSTARKDRTNWAPPVGKFSTLIVAP